MPGTLEDPELLELLNTTFAGAASSQSRTRARDPSAAQSELATHAGLLSALAQDAEFR